MGGYQGPCAERGGGMRFAVIDAPQRSDAWFRVRAGKLTGSRACDMLATIKSGAPSASRKNLLAQLVLERITGKPQESSFTSDAMRDGIEREADALALYEAVCGQVVQRSGFIVLNGQQAGCSLDGHVGDYDGIVEGKAPIAATHLEYLKSGKVPEDYMRQIIHNLWVTGAQWCDWLSYHPDFPESLQVKVVRIDRDEKAIAEYEKKALAFLAEVDAEEAALRTSMNLAGTLQAVAS